MTTQVIHSVYPCTEQLTFGPWIYLVPQFPPRSVLMLGYGDGTAAGLMRKLYGHGFPITAVDINAPKIDPVQYGVNFHKADARLAAKAAGLHEVCIVDLWDYDVPEFIFEPEFVEDVGRLCDYLVVHCMDYNDTTPYDSRFPKVRTLGLDYGARFHYYMVNRIARAPFRGRST